MLANPAARVNEVRTLFHAELEFVIPLLPEPELRTSSSQVNCLQQFLQYANFSTQGEFAWHRLFQKAEEQCYRRISTRSDGHSHLSEGPSAPLKRPLEGRRDLQRIQGCPKQNRISHHMRVKQDRANPGRPLAPRIRERREDFQVLAILPLLDCVDLIVHGKSRIWAMSLMVRLRILFARVILLAFRATSPTFSSCIHPVSLAHASMWA